MNADLGINADPLDSGQGGVYSLTLAVFVFPNPERRTVPARFHQRGALLRSGCLVRLLARLPLSQMGNVQWVTGFLKTRRSAIPIW